MEEKEKEKEKKKERKRKRRNEKNSATECELLERISFCLIKRGKCAVLRNGAVRSSNAKILFCK